MATDIAVRRYRTWYAMLLRLYPRPFRERFGEGMAQTFHDLCREHRDARRGLLIPLTRSGPFRSPHLAPPGY